MTTTTTDDGKLDNMTVRRFAKLLKNNSSNTNTSTPITTGKVVQNGNSLYVAIDDETLVPISDTSATVNVGDVVTIALTDESGLIVGNNTDKSVATTNLTKTANGLKLDIEGKASKAELTLESDKLQSSITDTKEELNSTITQTATDIRSEVKAGDDALGTQITQTAEGLTVKINTAQDTADTAKTNAATAQTTANTAKTNAATAQTTANAAKTAAANAQTSADDAKKVATNYLSFNSTDGLVVGDMTGTLKNNTQITSSGVNIRNGSTVLASFEDDEIALGKNSTSSTISLCQDSAFLDISESGHFTIRSKESTDFSTFNPAIGINPGGLSMNGSSYSAKVTISPYQNVSLSKGVTDKNGYHFEGEVKIDSDSIYATVDKMKIGGSDPEYETAVLLNKTGFYVVNNGASGYGLVQGETVLYNNTTGTTSTVTLSESAAKFTYLEIYYNCNKNAYGSVKVYSPNGKKVQLQQTFWASGTSTTQTDFETISISGTTISRGTEGYFQTAGSSLTTGTLSSRQFYITRVVGIK